MNKISIEFDVDEKSTVFKVNDIVVPVDEFSIGKYVSQNCCEDYSKQEAFYCSYTFILEDGSKITKSINFVSGKDYPLEANSQDILKAIKQTVERSIASAKLSKALENN